MLVVRKGGGRNINNDRYIYINVDDAPNPFPELRRLLDINLGLLWQEKVGQLTGANNLSGAREAAAKVARYQPQSMQAQMTLGLLDEPQPAINPAALEECCVKAKAMDSRGFFHALGSTRAAAYLSTSILEDKEFPEELPGN